MTRKEVCKATGLTVKTLRLYEEKGLIVPAKERRNGREYREYTPELVEQLKQIVTLRRALFTMDEIKIMQERPDAIPGIFRDYQAWLEGQERQFHLLRQAAEKISEHDLGSLEGLLSGLENAAEQLPLPAMDVKPNFKRLDEMEEEPRHVAPQVNFDETVPDAKVFRQMNIVMDGDRANNVNIAFGQFNATREAFAQPTGSGIVQRERKLPKWQKVTRSILTALVVVCFLLYALLSNLTRAYVYWPLVCGGILLAARIALSAVPAFLEHRAWLKQAQQEDYDRQQKRFATDAGGYDKERRRKRKIVLLSVAGALVVIALIAVLTWVLYVQAHPATDYRVCFASPATVWDEDLEKMETALAPLVGDLDGNGKVTVDVFLAQVTSRGAQRYRGSNYDIQYLEDFMSHGSTERHDRTVLFLIPDLEARFFNLCDELNFPQYCQKLPEDLAPPSAIRGSAYRVDLTGTKLFAAADLEELPVYGCIALDATQEEYDQAVALLRAILAQ